jgi:hypothetical protein
MWSFLVKPVFPKKSCSTEDRESAMTIQPKAVARWSVEKLAADLFRGGRRISEKIMFKQRASEAQI